MRRLLGHLTACAALGVLLATTVPREAKGAFVIDITIADLTAGTSTSYSIVDNLLNDSNLTPDVIQQIATLNTSASGVSITGINANSNLSGSSLQLTDGGTATIVGFGGGHLSDTYQITIVESHDGYFAPPGVQATLTQSESGTYSFTTPGGTQTYQSWFDPTNTLSLQAGSTPGQQSIPIPVVLAGTLSASENMPNSVAISPYNPAAGFALTSSLVITMTGNGNAMNNSTDVFSTTTTLNAAVPEPASMVMFLTGMPLPLVVLGLLRRHRRAVA